MYARGVACLAVCCLFAGCAGHSPAAPTSGSAPTSPVQTTLGDGAWPYNFRLYWANTCGIGDDESDNEFNTWAGTLVVAGDQMQFTFDAPITGDFAIRINRTGSHVSGVIGGAWTVVYPTVDTYSFRVAQASQSFIAASFVGAALASGKMAAAFDGYYEWTDFHAANGYGCPASGFSWQLMPAH